MKVERVLQRIHCPINLFDGCEHDIERLTAAIGHAASLGRKEHLSDQLIETVEKLLDCRAYDPSNFNCRLCRDFSTLRHKAARMIDRTAASRC